MKPISPTDKLYLIERGYRALPEIRRANKKIFSDFAREQAMGIDTVFK